MNTKKYFSFITGLILRQNRCLLISLMVPLLFATSGCLVTRQQMRESVKSETLTPEQQKRTDNEVRYQELETLVRETSGRIDVLENSVNTLKAEKSGAGVEQQNEKRILQEKLKIFEEAITKLEAQNVALQKRVDDLQGSLAAASTANKDSSASSAAGNKSIFDTAEQSFAKKKWKEAIVSYEKYRSTYPGGRRYAEATYKIGASFHELGMKAEAKVFYTEVTEKFAKSDWAKKSQERLRALK